MKKKITLNALSAIIQVAFTAILYFFLYKYLLKELGVKQLGVWSLILSFSSIANLSNFGITSGLVKFVAEYLAIKEEEKIGKLILTALVSITLLFSIGSLLVFFAAHYCLHFIIDKEFLSLALNILPYSLLGLCLNAASGVFTSALEGHQKNYLRNFIYILSGIVMFLSMVILTPIYHLKGMAYAQLIQAVFILITSLILMIRVNPYNRFSYWKWSNQSFKELFNYGYKFQIVSVSQLFYEPTTKILLSKYGGLAMLGHYEMASRLVNQFRALLVNANQVLIPVVVEKIKTQTKDQLMEFYAKINRILFFFTVPLSTLLILFTPLISNLWIGYFEPEFVYAVDILAIATLFNIMCGPSYFSCLAEGRLSNLLVVHISMVFLNLILGFTLGLVFGGYGIVLGWGIAFLSGSVIIIISYSRSLSINYLNIFSKKDKVLMIVSTLIIISVFIFSYDLLVTVNYKNLIISVIILLLYLPIILKNDNYEMVKSLLNSIKKSNFNITH